MKIATDQGSIPVELNVTQAPCTAASFAYLASKKFFNNTKCHRLTTAGIFVLQCGDPSGTGSGGPGYTIQDENIPATDPQPGAASASSAPAVTSVVYKAGTVAIALTGDSTGAAVPNSGSSQFFLVYKDSPLPASYPQIGTIDASGLTVLDKIAAAGVDPSSSNASDGAPKLATTIQTLTVGKIRPLPAVTPTVAPTPSGSAKS
jgi:peptidyl-prolyl cis-trans isomerase B (cyclophilin B)